MVDDLISVSKNLTAIRLGLEVNWHYSNPRIDPSVLNTPPQQEYSIVVTIIGVRCRYDNWRILYYV